MNESIQSLIQSGTKLYLDSVEPGEVDKNLAWGAVGATSNPAIISSIIEKGGLDSELQAHLDAGKTIDEIAWQLTDKLVRDAQEKFHPIWKETKGNAGWVSFELDPLLEDPAEGLHDEERTEGYIDLAHCWSKDHENRMIKVPATPAGIAALETLAAEGVTLNVTLIFTAEQYRAARQAIWRGASRRSDLAGFKSVYSIFISRIDVYTQKELPELSQEAQGQVGILNAKRIWAENQKFWSDKPTQLEQELIFASTGTKDPEDDPWKYVQALAGSDIQTNPPETNEAVATSGIQFERRVNQLPPSKIQDEIDAALNSSTMQSVLMSEGVAKFVKPQRALLELITSKKDALKA
jgi:transaldolase